MLAEYLGYGYGFKEPEKGGPFFGEYGVDLSRRIVRADHDGRSTRVTESQCKGPAWSKGFVTRRMKDHGSHQDMYACVLRWIPR